jgi:exodeoxyribonuclease VII small subunit
MDAEESAAPESRPERAPREGPGFDQRLERLQSIVSELEQGELGLESAIERYQEGIELLKTCHGQLEGYRKRVEELSADAEASLRPYEADPDFPAD